MKISNSFGRLDDLFVLSGKDLIGYVTDYDKLIPRTILEDIVSYLEDLNQPKLLELYGLRRTGKTVLIFQSISYLLKRESLLRILYTLSVMRIIQYIK